MTVAADVSYAELSWTGVETSFNPGIKAQSTADIALYYVGADGVIVTLTAGVHLTLSKAGIVGETGTITGVPATMPAAPGVVIFDRFTSSDQGTSFKDLPTYSATTHEKLHDRAALRDTEIRRKLARSLMVPVNETIGTLPAAALRAGLVLGFDALGALALLASEVSQFYFVTAAPSNAVGANEDVALNTTSGDIYKKIGGVWVLQGNLRGPQGIQGIPGTTVAPDITVRTMDTTNSDPATSGYTNGQNIGGVVVATGQLVLRNSTSNPARNGIWVVAASGGAVRDNDYDTFDEHPGKVISVQEGTNADTMWLCTADIGGTLNTTAITWKQKDAAATDTAAGIVELATDTEARTGTDAVRAVTPANLTAATIMQGKHPIALPTGAWKAKASGGATAATYQDIPVWSFNGTSATRIRCVIPMPKSWNEGTITFKAFGVVDTGGASGNVAVWKMAAQAFSHDDPAWTTTDLSTGAQAANMSWTANDDVLISAESPAITIANTPADGDVVVFEFWRDPADASDNNTADFLIYGVHIYITYNLPTEA